MAWIDFEDLQKRVQNVAREAAAMFERLFLVAIYCLEICGLAFIMKLLFKGAAAIEGSEQPAWSEPLLSSFTWVASLTVATAANFKHIDELSSGRLSKGWDWVVAKYSLSAKKKKDGTDPGDKNVD